MIQFGTLWVVCDDNFLWMRMSDIICDHAIIIYLHNNEMGFTGNEERNNASMATINASHSNRNEWCGHLFQFISCYMDQDLN